MRAWNSITACGHIINPDFRQVKTKNGTMPRMQWSFAFPDPRDPKDNDKTTWVTCTAWGGTAELIEKYCTEVDGEGKLVARKGSAVGVVGTLTNEKYTDKQGILRISTKINVERLHLMGSAQQQQEDNDQRPVAVSSSSNNNNNRQQPQQPKQPLQIPDLPF